MQALDPQVQAYLDQINTQKSRSQDIQDRMDQLAMNTPKDYSIYDSLAKASAGLGAIGGGHTSDTSSVDDASKGFQQQDLQQQKTALGSLENQQNQVDKDTGLNQKTLEYLQGRQDKSQARADDQAFKHDMLSQKNDALLQTKQASQGVKDDKTNQTLLSNLQNDLDPNKGRAGNLAFNQKKVDQADRLQGLINDSNGNVSNLDSRQIEELAIGVNSMLSNSSSSAASQVKALVPQSAWGDATKLKEWLTNNPTGTDQTSFVKRMSDTVQREKDIATDQVRKAQVQRLGAYGSLKQKAPEEYGAVLRSYGIDPDNDIDSKGQYISRVKKAPDIGQGQGGTALGAQMPAGPKQGDIEDGHLFKGGDPSDPANWEKQ